MRYKELKIGEKVFKDKLEIDDLLIKHGFSWVIDAEIENAHMEIIKKTFVWNSGLWYNGEWTYGVFRNGEWRAGIWKSGVFYNGSFKNGVFKNGIIFNGNFINSEIIDGEIKGGSFINSNISETVIRNDIKKESKLNTNFTDFLLEINRKDKKILKEENISNDFTIGFEFELETTDYRGAEDPEDDKTEINKIILASLKRDLIRVQRYDVSKCMEFAKDLLDEIALEDDDDFILDELLDTDRYEEDFQKTVIERLLPQIIPYYYNESITYLKSKVEKYLPNFYNKWKDEIKLEIDNTLERGIEISNKTYCNSINEAETMLIDFFTDYNNQKYWKQNNRTGIHINIGTKTNKKWNPLKGILMIGDEVKDNKTPYLFKNMEWRINNKYTGSVIKAAKKDLKDDNIWSKRFNKLDFTNFNEVESFFNEYLPDLMRKISYKEFGFNIVSLQTLGYVEFRYAGGNVKLETILEKLIFFCYIIYLMTNKKYKEDRYQKKLYKFIDELKDEKL